VRRGDAERIVSSNAHEGLASNKRRLGQVFFLALATTMLASFGGNSAGAESNAQATLRAHGCRWLLRR
jgi:hypothetical protein